MGGDFILLSSLVLRALHSSSNLETLSSMSFDFLASDSMDSNFLVMNSSRESSLDT